MTRIGIVAGEASGDFLGADLMEAIKRRMPGVRFEGIAGPRMVAAGCRALYPSDKLAVMGLVEVLAHLREILGIRRHLLQHFLRDPPDVVIGIDAPDFNLPLETKLRAAGVRTVHYVSPTVWAWRQRRVRGIARAVDLMLTVFPFEADFYREHGVPVRFVGHPLADAIPLEADREAARKRLGIAAQAKVVALLPGSRRGEVQRLAGVFLEAALRCQRVNPDLLFVAPMAGAGVRVLFERALAEVASELPVTLVDGQSQEVLAAADVALLASGTAALEALLLRRPMVVAYRLAPLTHWLLIRLRMLKIARYSLPNLLAGREVVPEFVQDDADPDNLAAALMGLLEDPQRSEQLQELFGDIHGSLRCNASTQAAAAVVELIGHGPVQGEG